VVKNTKIKAAFFDIGNVLLSFRLGDLLDALASAARARPERVRELLVSRRLARRVERGEISGREVFDMFRRDLGYRGDFQGFRKLWCDHFTLDRAAERTFRRVARVVPVFFLSNTNELHFDYISERYRFPALASGAALSFKLGMSKPEPGIYLAALRMAVSCDRLFESNSANNSRIG
jgi:FMN phosphatase YigB (HAD superfamily)